MGSSPGHAGPPIISSGSKDQALSLKAVEVQSRPKKQESFSAISTRQRQDPWLRMTRPPSSTLKSNRSQLTGLLHALLMTRVTPTRINLRFTVIESFFLFQQDQVPTQNCEQTLPRDGFNERSIPKYRRGIVLGGVRDDQDQDEIDAMYGPFTFSWAANEAQKKLAFLIDVQNVFEHNRDGKVSTYLINFWQEYDLALS